MSNLIGRQPAIADWLPYLMAAVVFTLVVAVLIVYRLLISYQRKSKEVRQLERRLSAVKDELRELEGLLRQAPGAQPPETGHLAAGNNWSKIVVLQQRGRTTREIADELGVVPGAVDLSLKIQQIRSASAARGLKETAVSAI